MFGTLVVGNVSKRYGTVQALNGVSATFQPGEIHAVVGENGAGKSTLVQVVGGFLSPESGSVSLDGRKLPLGDPRGCKATGVELVHQHFALVPQMTVRENLALALLPALFTKLDDARMTERALQQATELGWRFDPGAMVASLPVGVQQRLEILKSLSRDASVVMLDEPTAVLSPDEVDDLFRVLAQLRTDGKTIVLIAHKLSEVMAVSDRVTVLRGGRVVATAITRDVDDRQLAGWMVGQMPPMAMGGSDFAGGPLLVAEGLVIPGDRGEQAIRGVSFEIRKGEILGFGGVDGNGQTELAEALAGVRPIAGGSITWKGTTLDWDATRVGYIPQDRQSDGMALSLSVEDNLLIEGHRRHGLSSSGWLKPRSIRSWAKGLVSNYEVKVASLDQPASSLSGGNQQKVVVSRVLDSNPDLLVAASPGRGLDVRATRFVHEKLREARANGIPVALFSTDLDELAALANRVHFMSRGELVEGNDAASLLGHRP